MKNLKIFLLILLITLSFYLTDKIMIYMENQNPLMQEIDQKAVFYETQPVNAKTEDNTIIPGLKGKKVNRRRSYLKMGDFGSFNQTFLIFDNQYPDISLKDHLDKVIIRGNAIKRSVSLILEPNAKGEEYLSNLAVKYTSIANLSTDFSLQKEYINGEATKEKMSDVHAILNRNKINPKICLIGYSNPTYCQEKKYYIVAASLDTKENITQLLTKIKSGEIILVRSQTSIASINLILNEIKRQDLELVNLSTLISENN